MDHERLDVYQCALRFVEISFGVLDRMPKGQSELVDQLRRATVSIPLNIAEGTGKPSLAERKRFYGIARGSAMECAAILDLLRIQRFVDPKEAADGKELISRTIAMLTKLCR